jgi:L-fucose isomerase-like protein
MHNATNHIRPKVGVIFLGRKRPGFDMDWGRAMEERVRASLPAMAPGFVEPEEKVVDETTLRRALSRFGQERVSVLVVLQCTMGDGRLSQTVAQSWSDPIILWATPEKQTGEMISSCSLVGTHCWGSVLRQLGHMFEVVYGEPENPRTQKRFGEAVRLALTARRLRTARMGLVGGQAPGYFAMSADPFAIYKGLGAQIQTYSLLEFDGIVKGLDDRVVAGDVARFKALGIPHKDTTDDDLPMASRLYLAMRHYFDNEGLDALTVRCWPEMAPHFGQWPYLGIARLAEEGRAVGCEGDADGAFTAFIGESLGLGRCYLSDWLEHDDETITTWHIGAAPFSFAPPPGEPGGPRIARHYNIRKPAVVDATVIENMPVTLVRFWRCDGKYHLTAREGVTIKPRRHLMATNALTRMDNQNPSDWFETLCHEGMPHHIALFHGRHEALLRRFGQTMNMRFI